MEFKRKINKVGCSLNVIIPRDLAKFLNLNKGDSIIFTEKDGIITLRKKEDSQCLYQNN